MTEFDYTRAHAEIAAPLYRTLSKRVMVLLGRVDFECKDLHQNKDLDMPWAPGLREAFERLDTHELAYAAQVVHDFGHWGSPGCWQENGTYWKFSNYCDQVLRGRLGLKRNRNEYGVSFGIQEGQLHVDWASTQAWLNRGIGPASAGLLKAARSERWIGAENGDGELPSDCVSWFERSVDRFLKAHPVGDLSEYMVDKG